jgi:hypothetical protein
LKTEVTKTQNKDFYLQHSESAGDKNLCFVLWLPLFSICESAEGKNLCFVFWLPLFSICESAGGKKSRIEVTKTQSKDFYLQHSHKLRTEVTKHKTKIFISSTLTNFYHL